MTDLIIKMAEDYSVSDMKRMQELKDLFMKGGHLCSSNDRKEALEVYCKFAAHKLVFNGQLDLEPQLTALIGCGCKINIGPCFEGLNEDHWQYFYNFCKEYTRSVFENGFMDNNGLKVSKETLEAIINS